ncbi:MAG: FKBP-type peptidyl-prolyl cis-trans isomerase [Pseudomonadota bacterium]
MRIALSFSLAAAFAGAALLTACGPSETSTPEVERDVSIDGPLADLIPWNSEAEGVQTTQSGLQYVVLSKGEDGGKTPGPRDRVTVMYEGRLTDGTVFDSAYERGSTSSFGVNQVIAGWTEGLQLMSEGDEFAFYIPSDIAYGDNPRPGGLIKPGDDLIFRVELKEVQEAPKPRATDDEAWSTYTPWSSDNPDVIKTESGLEYVVLATGDPEGTPPLADQMAVVYYEGRFAETGEVFDSGFQRGQAMFFQPNQVIPGWREALMLMRPGDRWLLHIPSDLAYGPSGHPAGIPPNADLNFEVELMDVVPVQ